MATVEPYEYVPPRHGEPAPRSDGRGSNVQEAWTFDPTPIRTCYDDHGCGETPCVCRVDF